MANIIQEVIKAVTKWNKVKGHNRTCTGSPHFRESLDSYTPDQTISLSSYRKVCWKGLISQMVIFFSPQLLNWRTSLGRTSRRQHPIISLPCVVSLLQHTLFHTSFSPKFMNKQQRNSTFLYVKGKAHICIGVPEPTAAGFLLLNIHIAPSAIIWVPFSNHLQPLHLTFLGTYLFRIFQIAGGGAGAF